MYRRWPVAIVDDRVLLVLRLDGARLLRGDQLGLGLVNFEFLELRCGLCAVCRAEFGARIRKVARDGVLAEAQPLGDLAVCPAQCGKLEDLKLALGESGPAPSLRDEPCSLAELVVMAGKTGEGLPRGGGASGAQSGGRGKA